MFDYDQPKEEEPVDYTGLKIVTILAPVFFLVTFLSNPDMGLAACMVLGMIILAIKMRWNLRKYVWFWGTIIFILAPHVPLVFLVRWPQGNVPTLFYTMPIGIADFFIVLGAVGLAQRLFLKDSSSSQGLDYKSRVPHPFAVCAKEWEPQTSQSMGSGYPALQRTQGWGTLAMQARKRGGLASRLSIP